MPPLGILYLAAWLEKHGHTASIIDLAGVDDWRTHLHKEKHKLDYCDVLGFTATTPQYGISQQINRYIHQALGYDMKSVVGGIHTTSLVHANEMDFLQKDGFDSYVIGEGYNAVTKLCQDLLDKSIPSKLYSEPILKDVNLLPFAARHLIDIKAYNYKLGDKQCTTCYSQYGCYYNCSFCESPMAGAWTVRAMTPQRIYDECKYIIDRFDISSFMYFDDEMNLDRKRLLGICEKHEQLRHEYPSKNVTWRGFMVTNKWDREMAEACKRSGCYEVASGIESGSPKVMRAIKKPATLEINRRFLITAKKAGLRTKAFMIVGLPYESWDTIRESYNFLKSLREEGCAPDDIDVSILQIYPGSPLYQDPKDITFEKYTDYDKMYYKSSPTSYSELIQVKTAAMSKDDLIAARNLLEHEFKPTNWVEDHTGRKDYDRVAASIQYAQKKIL